MEAGSLNLDMDVYRQVDRQVPNSPISYSKKLNDSIGS
jgi:hypothetical protein